MRLNKKFSYEKLFEECYENGIGNIKKIEEQLGFKIPKLEQRLWKDEKSLKSVLKGLEQSTKITATLYKDDTVKEFIKNL